jgi:hypothetical protein
VQKWGLVEEYSYPLLVSPRYSKFFTFTENDWKKLKNADKPCYVFTCHKPKHLLPRNVKEFIKWGETEPLVRVREGEKPKTANESTASMAREKNRKNFYGWYDLGDIKFTPICTSRRAQYYHRFVLFGIPMALDDGLIAFIPKQKIKLDDAQLKAMLAYLNSSFSRFFIETGGRSTGGGVIELDVKSAEKLPILDVRQLSQEQIQELRELFTKLEDKTRKIGGADTQEKLEKLQSIIDEIDASVAKMLGLGNELAENLRTVTKILAERRISRTRRARPEAVKGEEEPMIKPPRKKEN